MSPGPDERPDDIPKPFLEHLEDLRRTVLRMAAVLGLTLAVAVPLAPRTFALMVRPLRQALGDPAPWLRSLQVAGAFALALRVSFWSALIASAPVLVYLLTRFVYPGLTLRERRVVTGALWVAGGLFVLGVVLGYFLTLPLALRVMFATHEWMGIRAEWVVTDYVVFALQLLLAFGLVFELPVVVVVLGRLGLITSQALRHYRRHAIVLILIVAAMLTPPDVVTQILMAVPLIVLYEVCIWMIAAGERVVRQ